MNQVRKNIPSYPHDSMEYTVYTRNHKFNLSSNHENSVTMCIIRLIYESLVMFRLCPSFHHCFLLRYRSTSV